MEPGAGPRPPDVSTPAGPPGAPSPWSYAGIGFEIVAPVLLGVFAGRWLDTRWGSRPWLLIVGSVLGIVVGFYSFLRRFLPIGRADRWAKAARHLSCGRG